MSESTPEELLAAARQTARETLAELEHRTGAAPSGPISHDDERPARIVAIARRVVTANPGVLSWLAGKVVAVPMQAGGHLMLDLGDWTSWGIVELRGWEIAITDVCLRAIKPGAVVLDVGAHIGGHALAYARRSGAAGRVYAFEPVPANIALLRQTIAINRVAGVISIEPVAIGDAAGAARLHAYSPDATAARYPAGSGMLHSLVAAADYAADAIDVELTTLDAWSAARGIERADFIKIDVEGAELMVLRGARALLERSPAAKLVVEVHPVELAAAGSSVAEVLDALRAMGFRLYEPVPGRLGTVDLAEVAAAPRGQHILARR